MRSKLNSNEAPAGYKAVLGTGHMEDCDHCAFKGDDCNSVQCTRGERRDCCSVYFVKETTVGGPCASPNTSERENMNNEPSNDAPEVTSDTPAYDLTAPEVAEDPRDVLRREDTQSLRRSMAEFDRRRREAVEELADMLLGNLDYIGPICLVAIPRPGEVLVSKDLKTGRLKSADSAIMVRIASPDEAVVLHSKMEEIIKGDRRDRAGLPHSSLEALLRGMRAETEEED